MVLKNSKWDKKAKYLFMKKHGIATKSSEPKVDRPKWSGKRKDVSKTNQVVLVDSDEEWDSDADDALINHFYPQLGDELTKEQKVKIKEQIFEEYGNGPVEGELKEEKDGIYLGTEQKDEGKKEETLPELIAGINLQDLIKSKKTRKLLKPKMSDNILDEYGISSYDDTTRSTDDYNDVYEAKKKDRHINDISAQELDGFVIGEPLSQKSQGPKNNVIYLSNDEKQAEQDRAALAEKNRLFKQIKNRFTGQPKTSKVLEINNLDQQDNEVLAHLNTRLSKNDKAKLGDDEIDEYLDILLESGAPKTDKSTSNDTLDLDELSNTLPTTSYKAPEKSSGRLQKPTNYDDTFLDDLLG